MTAAIRDWQGPLRATWERIFPVDSIVVPLDGSAVSKTALPVARALARLERGTLHVLYVGDRQPGRKQTLQQLGLTPEELRGAVLDDMPGPAAEAVMRKLEKLPHSLLVLSTEMGTHRRQSSLGSIADGVLAQIPQRIVLVPPQPGLGNWQVWRVLLAHNGTPSSDLAIAPAADIARRAGAEVIALHVADRNTAGPTEPGSLPAPRYLDQPQHEWPSWAREFVDRMLALGQAPATMKMKLLVTGGQAGSEVAQYARDHAASLVVLAWRGRWESRRQGKLKVIVRRSNCPVLLISAHGAPARGVSLIPPRSA